MATRRLGYDSTHDMESKSATARRETNRRLAVLNATIRPVLSDRLRRQHAKEADTVLIEELGLSRGLVRVDLAVVNGSLHGF